MDDSSNPSQIKKDYAWLNFAFIFLQFPWSFYWFITLKKSSLRGGAKIWDGLIIQNAFS